MIYFCCKEKKIMKEKLIIRLKDKFKEKNFSEKTIDGYAGILSESGLVTDENLDASIENILPSLEAFNAQLLAAVPAPVPTPTPTPTPVPTPTPTPAPAPVVKTAEEVNKELMERLARIENERANDKFLVTLREKAKTANIRDEVLAGVLTGRNLASEEDVTAVFDIATSTQKTVDLIVSEKYAEDNYVPGGSGSGSEGFLSDMAKLAEIGAKVV